MNRQKEELRKALGIDEWLELIKEDKNCNGAYVSFGQYMDILEKKIDKVLGLLFEIDSCIMKREYAKANRRVFKARNILKGDTND